MFSSATIVGRRSDFAMVLAIAAIFILAVVYSVFSATTVSSNITTDGHIYATSTVQATGNILGYASVGVGTTAPGTALAVHNGTSLLGGPVTADGLIKGPFFLATSSTASTFPVASTTSFSAADRIWVAGLGTSTVTGGLTVGTSNGTFGVGTATPRAEVGITGDLLIGTSATTTITVDATDASSRSGCIELRDNGVGRWIRIYPGGTAATTSGSQTIASGGAGLLVIETGRCQ